MSYSVLSNIKSFTANFGAYKLDSGFGDFNSSDKTSEMYNSEEPCTALRNMSLEVDKDEQEDPVEINFKWSQVQMSFIQQSPELSYLQDNNGDTLLHQVIGYGNMETSLWLISLAPDASFLNLQNDKSYTVLHEAVACEETNVTRRLILSGANPTIRTFSGNTALHIACLHGSFDCARALVEPLSPMEKNWRCQKTGTQSPAVPQDLEIVNFQGKTCLHLAASNGFLDIVVLLVYSGADVNATEGMGGKTAIHLAIQNRHRDVVKFLARERPACLEALTWSGCSVYQLAQEVDPELAEELLKLGADPQLGTYSDYTDEESMSDSSSDS